MPLYEYKCEKCEDVIEVLQRVSDEPLTECKKCGGKTKRLISGGASFRLIGDGFYAPTGKME